MLISICTCAAVSVLDPHASSIVFHGGFEVVFSALSHHRSIISVVEECCGCLWMLTRCSQAWNRIPIQKIIHAADEVIQLHHNQSGVQNFATGNNKSKFLRRLHIAVSSLFD